jgi:hypothetical protein
VSNISLLRKIDAVKALQRSTGFSGEADAATAAIKRLEARLAPNSGVQRVGLLGPWQRTAWLLLLSGMKWSDRERDFLESMRCKRSAPSERQTSWLADLKARDDVHRADSGWA